MLVIPEAAVWEDLKFMAPADAPREAMTQPVDPGIQGVPEFAEFLKPGRNAIR